MRYALPLAFLLLTSLFAGCGMMKSASVPVLSEAHAVELAEQFYNHCGDGKEIHQCEVIDAFGDDADAVARGMTPYVRLVRVAQSGRARPVATSAGSRYALNKEVLLPGATGGSLDDVVWRVLTVRVQPLTFEVHGDVATLHGVLVVSPTPLQKVYLERSHDPRSLQTQREAQGRRVAVHFKFADDRWLIVPPHSVF
jgi:hypothetical protein